MSDKIAVVNADAIILLRRIADTIQRRLESNNCDLRTLAEQTRQTAELVIAEIDDQRRRVSEQGNAA